MTKKILTAIFLIAAILYIVVSVDDSADTPMETNAAQASPVAATVPSFSAKTVTGETVTNEIFAAKKITVVNIWATFCPPCIGEMPELGEWARSMPDNAQIIGIVHDASDGSDETKEALRILQEAGADFVNIVPDQQLNNFISGVEVVPTTIFVNSKGEVVGNAIFGADVDGYKAELKRLLNE